MAHYYILILPFTILIAIILLDVHMIKVLKIIFILLLLFPITKNIHRVFVNTQSLIVSTERENQIHQSDEISKFIGNIKNKTVYCFDGSTNFVYFLNKYQPPLIRKYGYSFGFDTSEDIKERLNVSDFLIITENSYKTTLLKNESRIDIIDNLKINFSLNKITNEVYVFTRRENN